MNAVPLVSVIIPTFNRAHHLPRSIRSALAQTYPNVEVIIVNDASTDDTAAVLATFTDPRLRCLQHSTNQGAPAARNTGIGAARGEYVAFLDSDDEWVPEKLTIQMNALLEKRAKFCYCQTWTQTPSGIQQIVPQQPYHGGSLLKYLICDGGAMQTSGLVVHRDLCVPFDSTQFPHDDWDWVVRVFPGAEKAVFVAQPLYWFHTDAPARACDSPSAPLYERGQPFLRKHAAEIAAYPQIHRHLMWWYAGHAQSSGNTSLALRILFHHRVFPSLRQRPSATKLWIKCLLALVLRRSRRAGTG